jgi:UDP-glucose 4-epimerase
LLGKAQSFTVNLGTGEGTSVLGVVNAFERASGRAIPFEFAPRRAGDVAQYYADVSLAGSLLGWRAVHTIDDMCRDAWHWQQRNPEGYRTVASETPAMHAPAVARNSPNGPVRPAVNV